MFKRLILLIFTSGLVGCSTLSVKTDFDKAVDFSVLKTYAWKHVEQPKTGNAKIDNDLVDQRIRNAVEMTLNSKGYKQSEHSTAHFLIVYQVDYQRRIGGSSVSFGVGSGGYGRFGGLGYSTNISDYEEGSLILTLIDAKSERTIWRGVGTRILFDGSTPEKVTESVHLAVRKLLKRFPPQ